MGRHLADAGGRDVHPVGRAPVDHLGVAGDDLDARRPGRRRHVGDNGPQFRHRQTLLEHERGRQPPRLGTHHGEVVDGAVHGQVTDRTSREAQRLHDERVGAEHQALSCRNGQIGPVGHRGEPVIGEGLHKDGFDQGVRSLASCAVGQGDDLVGEAGTAPAEGLDAIEHSRFAARLGLAHRCCTPPLAHTDPGSGTRC